MNDMPESAGKKASLLNFLLTISIVVAGFVYVMKAAYSSDPLYFLSSFDSIPSQIELRCHGKTTYLEGSSAEAATITSLVNEQLSDEKRFDPLNLTDATYKYYRTDPDVVTLELIYAEPVRVHLPNMFFKDITSLLIPLEGRYAKSAIVFGLINEHPAGGSLHMNTNRPILDALASSGLCVIQ
jgi:hypothetical protein